MDGTRRLRGGRGADLIVAGPGWDGRFGQRAGQPAVLILLNGGQGPDVINGRAGRDAAAGDAGRDKLEGGRGRDFLLGGKGRDIIAGGPGRDACAANYVVRNCEVVEDA